MISQNRSQPQTNKTVQLTGKFTQWNKITALVIMNRKAHPQFTADINIVAAIRTFTAAARKKIQNITYFCKTIITDSV